MNNKSFNKIGIFLYISQLKVFHNSGPNSSLPSLASQIEQLHQNQTLTDLTILVGEHRFPVHRAILAARSPVFAAMFSHEMREKAEKEVRVEELDAEVFQNLLSFIYKDKINADALNKTSWELLAIAEKVSHSGPGGLVEMSHNQMNVCFMQYDVKQMKSICEKYIVEKLTINEAAAALALADMHNAESLKRDIFDFIMRYVCLLLTLSSI